MYGLWYRPYLERYGVTNEDLGRYVVQARAYAATNPAAWFYERWGFNLWVPFFLHCLMNLAWNVFAVGESADRRGDRLRPPLVCDRLRAARAGQGQRARRRTPALVIHSGSAGARQDDRSTPSSDWSSSLGCW